VGENRKLNLLNNSIVLPHPFIRSGYQNILLEWKEVLADEEFVGDFEKIESNNEEIYKHFNYSNEG
jgi:ribosomal protein S8